MIPLPTLSDTASDYLCVKINFQHTFSPELLPNSSDTFILGDFNAHHPTWETHISSDSVDNSPFNWISSSQLDILNDPNIHWLRLI